MFGYKSQYLLYQRLHMPVRCNALQCVAMRCNALQCVAMRCSTLQCVAVRCSALQCAAACRSVSQCVVVCCSVLQCKFDPGSNNLLYQRLHCICCSSSLLFTIITSHDPFHHVSHDKFVSPISLSLHFSLSVSPSPTLSLCLSIFFHLSLLISPSRARVLSTHTLSLSPTHVQTHIRRKEKHVCRGETQKFVLSFSFPFSSFSPSCTVKPKSRSSSRVPRLFCVFV